MNKKTATVVFGSVALGALGAWAAFANFGELGWGKKTPPAMVASPTTVTAVAASSDQAAAPLSNARVAHNGAHNGTHLSDNKSVAASTALGATATAGAPGAGRGGPAQTQPAQPLSPEALATQQLFARLRTMPAGDAAIELTQNIEAGLTPQNTAAYVQALLGTDDPAVERAAVGALSLRGDGPTLAALAAAYGTTPATNRGRILEVLESASNPDALPGLASIAAADVSEKRSPVSVSALVGVAHLGNKDSVQYLLSQVTPANGDYALLALGRVTSPQGIEMIRAAAAGNKDSAKISADYLPALRRIAAAAGP